MAAVDVDAELDADLDRAGVGVEAAAGRRSRQIEPVQGHPPRRVVKAHATGAAMGCRPGRRPVDRRRVGGAGARVAVGVKVAVRLTAS